MLVKSRKNHLSVAVIIIAVIFLYISFYGNNENLVETYQKIEYPSNLTIVNLEIRRLQLEDKAKVTDLNYLEELELCYIIYILEKKIKSSCVDEILLVISMAEKNTEGINHIEYYLYMVWLIRGIEEMQLNSMRNMLSLYTEFDYSDCEESDMLLDEMCIEYHVNHLASIKYELMKLLVYYNNDGDSDLFSELSYMPSEDYVENDIYEKIYYLEDILHYFIKLKEKNLLLSKAKNDSDIKAITNAIQVIEQDIYYCCVYYLHEIMKFSRHYSLEKDIDKVLFYKIKKDASKDYKEFKRIYKKKQ